ncbi:MAG: hypothetical protein H6R35_402 [Bacteroidetes bacterium]|nr:hypothetical protein [Bacteroidota bacterium]
MKKIQTEVSLLLVLITLFSGCTRENPQAEQWVTYEIALISEVKYVNAYTDIDVWAQFINSNEDTLIRPAFWDGGNNWKIRFSPPDAGSTWSWTTFSSPYDKGLTGKKGSLTSVAYTGSNRLLKHGLLKMSDGKRNVIHADGKPFLVVGDTPWSIPFRASTDQVKIYAADRYSL